MEPSAIELADSEIIKNPDEAPLDRAVRMAKIHIRRSADHIYKLGLTLKKIRDEELWMLRSDKETGRAKYDGFWDFVRAEIPISEGYTRRIIAVSEVFSLKQVRKHGVARLSVAMRLPEQKQKPFIDRVQYVPACSKEFREIAREMRSDEPVEKDHSSLQAAVTVPLALGLRVLPMWAREKLQGPSAHGVRPATTLADNPWTKMKLADDLMLYIRLNKNDRGEAIAIVEIRPGIETEETAQETNSEEVFVDG